MPQEPNMDDLLKKWAAAERAGELGKDCPELSVLFYHVTEGRHLDEHADHVAACPRCRKRLDLIRRELARLRGLRVLGVQVRRPVRWAAGFLALAASIALVFALWPEPSYEAPVAVFARFAYLRPDDATLRGGGTSTARPGDSIAGMPDWVRQVLADEQVKQALREQKSVSGKIRLELRYERLLFDQDLGLTVAPGVDRDSDHGRLLGDWVMRDRKATERIVDAIIQHLPGATETDRSAIRRALNDWRAAEDFGMRKKEAAK